MKISRRFLRALGNSSTNAVMKPSTVQNYSPKHTHTQTQKTDKYCKYINNNNSNKINKYTRLSGRTNSDATTYREMGTVSLCNRSLLEASATPLVHLNLSSPSPDVKGNQIKGCVCVTWSHTCWRLKCCFITVCQRYPWKYLFLADLDLALLIKKIISISHSHHAIFTLWLV